MKKSGEFIIIPSNKFESTLLKDERMKCPKFVLISEIDIEKEKVSALRNVISAIWEKVEDVSSDKQLELIKRKLHTDFMNHEPQTFDRDMEDYIWDILFNNK
jgi:hypothetical protein